MNIYWTKCQSYQEARNYYNIIYLHEWSDKPFYWGKAHKSFFGGHMRKVDGFMASGRYNAGYKHWIEGCLKHGAKLYIGKLSQDANYTIDEIEDYLIATYPSEMNSRIKAVCNDIQLSHLGEVPATIIGV